MPPLSLLAVLPLLFGQTASLPISPDSDHYETLAPALVPGSGWVAPTTEQVRSGFFAELTAIAHWTRMENQILWRGNNRDFQLGVLAYHRSLIDHVEFAVDGGPWLSRSWTSISSQTNFYEYGVRLRPEDFGLGWHEVRARIVPRQGTSSGGIDRILSWRFFSAQGLIPGVHYGERWVDSVAGSDGGTGECHDPFQSFRRAVEDLNNSATGANAAIIHLLGQDEVIPIGGTTPIVNNVIPLTVRPQDGHNPFFAPQSGGVLEELPIRHLRIENLRIDVSWNEMFRSGSIQPDAQLYFSECEFVGHTVPRQVPFGSVPTVYRLTELFDYAHGANVSMADCRMHDIDGTCHSFVGWMRGVHIRNGLVGGFAGSHCIIDCSVQDSPETQNITSSGLWVGSWGGVRSLVQNVLVDGLRVLDHTGLLLDVKESCNGVAIVNSTFDGINGAVFSQNQVGSVFENEQRHILLFHCTSPQRLEVDYFPGYLFRPLLGGWVTSCIFGDIYDRQVAGRPANANLGGDPANDGFSGPVVGMQIDPLNMHVHGNRPAWSSWSQQGYFPTYVDIWANKLRVRATAHASLTVPPADQVVAFDTAGVRRGNMAGMTTVGARIGIAE